MKDVNCPYCGHAQDINHDDGYGYSEEDIPEQHCNKCGIIFEFTTSIILHYNVSKKESKEKD